MIMCTVLRSWFYTCSFCSRAHCRVYQLRLPFSVCVHYKKLLCCIVAVVVDGRGRFNSRSHWETVEQYGRHAGDGPTSTHTCTGWLLVSHTERLFPSTCTYHVVMQSGHGLGRVMGCLMEKIVKWKIIIIIIIIITTTMFMVLSSWHSHCESSPDSFDECRLSARWQRNDLACSWKGDEVGLV